MDHTEALMSCQLAAAQRQHSHRPAARESCLEGSFGHSPTLHFAALFCGAWLAGLLLDSWERRGIVVDLPLLCYMFSDLHVAFAIIAATFSVAAVVPFVLVCLCGFGRSVCVAYALLQLLLIAGPIASLRALDPQWHPLTGALIVMNTAVFSMKVHSYFTALREHEQQHFTGAAARWQAQFGPYWRFLTFPTLCYCEDFPRSARVSPKKLVKHFGQCVVAFSIAYVCLADACVPAWREFLPGRPAEAFVRTMFPGFVTWMAMFFGTFHGLLNLVAEATCYADRHFYGPWWEAQDMRSWWRDWNCCVGDWMRQHIYVPALKSTKCSAVTASVIVFAVSALWHELILMAGLGGRPWPILSMCIVSQAGLLPLTGRISSAALGNALVWCAFFVGFPLVQTLYAYVWSLDHGWSEK
eukprot:TRINITY_DN4611_c0_g1_i2.p1 TRINITY_DN4611_c0_g1~~TRINITY_DN4611_c0_g1_i2.p1  ORF type:complete len:412 (+),score=63.38 TRINITY_DN4611_c0_g1_i2:104-1339(+)